MLHFERENSRMDVIVRPWNSLSPDHLAALGDRAEGDKEGQEGGEEAEQRENTGGRVGKKESGTERRKGEGMEKREGREGVGWSQWKNLILGLGGRGTTDWQLIYVL